ncbi:P27 family phage terminase small subunit [Mycobacterium sp.]|uniref:P27 family phage terminase small subunit n=1 Tax=Mycobacterium sp. TaxID=1785 RepID=UPI003F997AC2
MAGSQIPRAPTGLGPRGRALWREVHRSYVLDGVESELLHQLCAVLDRCDQIQAELATQPLMTSGSVGQPRPNPLLACLREEEKMLDRLASSLGVSMPNRAGASKGSGHARKAAQTRWSRATKAAVIPMRGA